MVVDLRREDARSDQVTRPRTTAASSPYYPGSLKFNYICYCGQVVVGWPICRACAQEMFDWFDRVNHPSARPISADLGEALTLEVRGV